MSERSERAMAEALEQMSAAERPMVTSTPAAAPPSSGLRYAEVVRLYRHALGSIAWALFWTSVFGGTAAAVTMSFVSQLETPLVVASFLAWGTLGGALSLAARSDSSKLRR